jgi:hypothetical protein
MEQSIPQDRDGFQVREGQFTLPTDTSNLDPQTKRAVTICNLFVNHQYGISDVVRVLDENRRNVIHVLLAQGIIRDRRVRQTAPPEGSEQRTPPVSRKVTLKTPWKTSLNSDAESLE